MTPTKPLALHCRLVLTPISPLCIGSGDKLGPLDFDLQAGHLVVKDVSRWLADPAVPLPRKLAVIQTGDARQVPLERYRIRAHLSRRPPEVISFIRNPFDRPYLPASSVKGAIRTALACALTPALRRRAPQRFVRALTNTSHGQRERASEDLEAALFECEPPGESSQRAPTQRPRRRDPTQDLGRLLVVRDSEPFPNSRLCAYECVLAGSSRSLAIALEAIAPDPSAPITLDFFIDVQRADDDPGFRSRNIADLLQPERLRQVLRRRGRSLIQAEKNHFAARSLPALTRFYQDLETKAATTAFLPIGFGAGWNAKTIGLELTSGEISQLRAAHRLGRRGESFPKTRKLLALEGQARWPLGWCQVEVQMI